MSSKTLKDRYGEWALITGASAGIGEEFARQMAAAGINLVLLARRSERLDALGRELSDRHGVQCRGVMADLNAPDFLSEVARQTADLDIGMLINNAGFTNHGEFLDNDPAAEARLVNVNCRAATTLAHHYGRLMRDRQRGAILFTASIVGFTSVPVWASYAASKGYDLLLAEALAAELKPHNIDVLALCPGSTRTEFADYQGFWARLLVMDADEVVRGALQNMGRRTVHIAGLMNRLIVFSFRFIPRRLAAGIFGKIVRDMAGN